MDADRKWAKLNLRQDAMGLVGAAIQVSRVATPETQEKARDILVDARKRMYRLLAEDESDQGETA
jgi:hypothetical protein